MSFNNQGHRSNKVSNQLCQPRPSLLCGCGAAELYRCSFDDWLQYIRR